MEDHNDKTELPFVGKADYLEGNKTKDFAGVNVLLAAIAVVLMGGLFIGLALYTPNSTLEEQIALPAVERTSNDQAPPPITSGDSLTPMQEAWRQQSLEISAKVAEARKNLEAKAVMQWASEAFEEFLEDVADSDKAYTEQRYKDARDGYAAALDYADRIDSESTLAFEEFSSEGRRLLAEQNYQAAYDSLEVASFIDPSDEEILANLNSALNGEKVSNLILKAEFYIDSNELSTASALLSEAKAIDPARSEIDGLSRKIRGLSRQLSFDTLLKDGHSKVAQNDFDAGIRLFQKALTLNSGSSEARDALSSAKTLKVKWQLDKLESQAETAMQSENWSEALDIFGRALEIQPNIEFAEKGQLTALFYNNKQQKLDRLLTSPLRLSDSAVYQSAVSLFQDLEGRELPSKLQLSLDQAKTVADKVRIPVSVNLISDNRSSVTILRGQNFSPFKKKTIQLYPGNYVFEARRNGYKNQRQSVTIPIGSPQLSIEIAANERF